MGRNKVLKNATIWKRVFIESFKTDFDYNGRWAKFQRRIGTYDAKKQPKMHLLKGKRKLPSSRSSRDVKGGIVTMKKKKALHKKANHEKERKANAALLQVIKIHGNCHGGFIFLVTFTM